MVRFSNAVLPHLLPLGRRVRRDEVGEPLHPGEIHTTVPVGPLGELAPLRQPHARRSRRPDARQGVQDAVDDGAAAVGVQLDGVLPGEAESSDRPQRTADNKEGRAEGLTSNTKKCTATAARHRCVS